MVIAFEQMYVNDEMINNYPNMMELYNEVLQAQNLDIFEKFIDYAYPLENNCKLYFPTKQQDNTHIFFFMLPAKEQQTTQGMFLKSSQLFAPS